MGNLKHTAVALAAVVMIGSLAVSQAEDLKGSYNIASLLSAGTSESVIYEEPAKQIVSVGEEEVQEELSRQYTEEELNTIIEEKSHASEAYVILTTGVLSVREIPSFDAPEIDALEKNSEIEIIESTEEWYKIRYADGKTGYAAKSQITENKEEAELAAKYYDNYRYGVVKTSGGTVNIRKGPSTSTEIIGELPNEAWVLLYWNEGEFAKVCYGEDYIDGYIIASAIQLQDSWLPKTQLTVKKQEVAERKAREAREKAEKEAREKAAREKAAKEKAAKEKAEKEAKAKAAAQKKSSSKTSSTSGDAGAAATSSSSKGQAIVNSAKKYLGVRYVYGGSSPSGFDCSGLVKYVCAQNGISMSRTSSAQALQGKNVKWSELQPGDLLFFAKNGRVHHVGIYAGGGQMIHAPHTGDVVKYSSINTAGRKSEFYCAKRVY